MAVNKLSAVKVNKLSKPGRYGDGGGLWLQVSQVGKGITKSWLFRYMLHGKARQMGLGPLHTVSLADARERARQARALLLDDIDPIDARRGRRDEAKAEAAKRITFKDAAEKYITAHRAGWKNEKHGEQWTATLRTYAYPVIGELSVAAVETSHIMKILDDNDNPLWTTKTETASRVRGRMEAVLDWAKARHYRTGENPARWRGHLDKLLPAKSKVRRVKHHDAMPYADVPAFVADLRDNDSVSARALEFTILTAVRTGEAIGAKWSEFDFAAKVWTVPGERTKSGREHRVPLSDRALEILASVPREDGNEHVFIGGRKGAGLSNMAMLELLRGMVENGLTVHGFRSSFRDWAGESTNFPREVAEAALAHVLPDKTEAAYRRGDALEKRRRLMDAWARYCARPVTAGDVVTLPARA
jgi:integrase